KAGGDEYVVSRRDDRGDAVLPFEADRDIDSDEEDRENGRDNARLLQLTRNLWPDNFRAPESISCTKCVADRIHHRLITSGAARLRLHPDQHAGIGRRIAFAAAEILQLRFGEYEPVHLRA